MLHTEFLELMSMTSFLEIRLPIFLSFAQSTVIHTHLIIFIYLHLQDIKPFKNKNQSTICKW